MFENWMRRGTSWPAHWLAEMDRFRREMDRTLDRPRTQAEFPPVNVWANADGVMVVAEVPGLAPDAVDISVSGGMLTLRGERKADAETLGTQSRAERARGAFSRTIELPFQIDSAKVEASCRDGLLEVRLPRADSDKPRKITVRGA